MRRALLVMIGAALLGGSPIYADDQPSERLREDVGVDHFTRYFCVSKFPEMRAQIQRAFDQSRIKYIPVPCRKLQCSDPEWSRGMQRLLERAQDMSEGEAREMCSSYPKSLKQLERQYTKELDALYPKRRAD